MNVAVAVEIVVAAVEIVVAAVEIVVAVVEIVVAVVEIVVAVEIVHPGVTNPRTTVLLLRRKSPSRSPMTNRI
jgi:hypothetical protein